MPTHVSQLRSLLSGISYNRRFLPNFAKRFCPIHRLSKVYSSFDFSPDMELVKTILMNISSPPILYFPNWNAAQGGSRKFRLYFDPSCDGFGVTFEQEPTFGSIRPITFPYSRHPSQYEKLAHP